MHICRRTHARPGGARCCTDLYTSQEFQPAGGGAAAAALESLAEEAARTAVELRRATDRRARTRKKRALAELLSALNAIGVSKHRSAVPASQRSVHAWFAQVLQNY